jgi:hypothetical protein
MHSAREKAADLERRTIIHHVFHPIASVNEHRRVNAMSRAARLHEQARIQEEKAARLTPTYVTLILNIPCIDCLGFRTTEEHLAALGERDFDDFDFEFVHYRLPHYVN